MTPKGMGVKQIDINIKKVFSFDKDKTNILCIPSEWSNHHKMPIIITFLGLLLALVVEVCNGQRSGTEGGDGRLSLKLQLDKIVGFKNPMG